MANKKEGYQFSERQTKLWNKYHNFDINTSIGRAWARAIALGYTLGSPTEDATEDEDTVTQLFQFALAKELPGDVNESVSFYDGHGHIVTQPGLD